MNFKVSGLIGAAVFILSFLLNLIGKWPRIWLTFLWAGIFGAGFFCLTLAIQWLVRRFFPELLEDSPSDDVPGSLVNITVDDETPLPEDDPHEPLSGVAPPPPQDAAADAAGNATAIAAESAVEPHSVPLETPVLAASGENYSNFSENQEIFRDTAKQTLDENEKKVYNSLDGDLSFSGGSHPEDSGALPDLEDMSGVFGMDGKDGEKVGTFLDMDGDSLAAELLPKAPTQGSYQPAGKFNAHEMAQAVQTILKRDDKG